MATTLSMIKYKNSWKKNKYDSDHEFYLRTTEAPEDCENPFFLVKGQENLYAAN